MTTAAAATATATTSHHRTKCCKLHNCLQLITLLVICFASFILYWNGQVLQHITTTSLTRITIQHDEQRMLEQQQSTTTIIDKSMKQFDMMAMNPNGLLRTKKKKKTNHQVPMLLPQNHSIDMMVDYFANNGYAKAFDTMQYPMGLYDAASQKTYICYQGPHEDPYIISYHHPSSVWDGPYRIGVSELGHDNGDPIQMHDGRKFAHGEVSIDPNTNRMKKTRKFQADNHGKPSIVIDTNGYIHISYGAHGGDIGNRKRLGINHYGDYSGGRQYHMRSRYPKQISSGFEIQNIGKSVYNGGRGRYSNLIKHSRLSWNGCYAQFIQVPNHNSNIVNNQSSLAIYHFVRHGAHVSCWTYQVSTNNGRTFGPVIPIVKTKQQMNDTVKDSWYCRFRGATDSNRYTADQYSHLILAICVYHNHWMPPYTHTLESHNAYYMYLDTRTGNWYNVHGDILMSFPDPDKDHYEITVDSIYYAEDPTKRSKLVNNETKLSQIMGLTKEMADNKARIIDTEHDSDNVFRYNYLHPGSVGIDEYGHPHILLKIAVDGELDGLKIGRGRKRLFYMKWTGTKWTTPIAITEHYFDHTNRSTTLQVENDEDGDIIIENSNHITVIFPINNDTHADISVFRTVDGGITWYKDHSLFRLENMGKLKISALIRHGHDNATIVAYNLDGTKKNDPYRKLYLFGKHGVIPRTHYRANICSVHKVSDTAVKCVKSNNNNNNNTTSFKTSSLSLSEALTRNIANNAKLAITSS